MAKAMLGPRENPPTRYTGPTVESPRDGRRWQELYVWRNNEHEIKAMREVLVAIGLYGQWRDDCLFAIYKAGISLPPKGQDWDVIFETICFYLEAMPPPRKQPVAAEDIPKMFFAALESWLGVK